MTYFPWNSTSIILGKGTQWVNVSTINFGMGSASHIGLGLPTLSTCIVDTIFAYFHFSTSSADNDEARWILHTSAMEVVWSNLYCSLQIRWVPKIELQSTKWCKIYMLNQFSIYYYLHAYKLVDMIF